jgi:hypothetical protein
VRLRNNCCHGNTKIRLVSIVVDLHVAANNIKNLMVPCKCNNGLAVHCYWVTIYVISYYYMSIGLYVKCPVFLSEFNQIWSFSTGFLKSLKYQVWLKSVQLDQRWYMRADRQDEDNTRSSGLRQTRLKPNTWNVFCAYSILHRTSKM